MYANMYNSDMEFEWDEKKNVENVVKHDVSFYQAQNAFFDPARIIHKDFATRKMKNDSSVLALMGKGL